MFDFFLKGGPGFMSILTLLLALLFFVAWKAPARVKEVGLFALSFSVLLLLCRTSHLSKVLAEVSEGSQTVEGMFDLISPVALFYGISIALIPVIYGFAIYLISLVIRFFQKPRL